MVVDYYGTLKEWQTNKPIRAHFNLGELANNSGNKAIPQFVIDKRVDEFLDMLELFRAWYNKPMQINSCYRQPAFNAKTKGADPASAHLHACAVDWWIPGHSEVQRNNVKTQWFALCKKHNVIGAVNFYKNGYHLEAYTDVWYGNKANQLRDYRGTPSDW